MVRPPTTKELYDPTLQALHNLGGSGTIHQINAEVVNLLQLAEKQGRVHRLSLRRARSHLKIYGLLENPRDKFWALTEKGRNTRQVDPDDVQRVRRQTVEQGVQEKNDSPVSAEATAIFDDDEDKKMKEVKIPTQKEFYNPTFQALHNLGGSGTTQEINAEVVRIMNLTDEQLKVLTNPGKRNLILVTERIGWARTNLKKYGLFENPRLGFWALTEKGRSTRQVNPVDVQRAVQQMQKEQREQRARTQKESVSPFSGEVTAIFDGDEETEMIRDTIPTINELYNPTLQALHNLGGSGTNQEIYDEVARIMNLTDEHLKVLTNQGKRNRTLVTERIGWARTGLKKYGLFENPRLGFWALTEEGRNTRQVEPSDVRRTVTQMAKEQKQQQEESDSLSAAEAGMDDLIWQGEVLAAEDVVASLSGWRDELSDILHEMSATAFERFFLRIFRESGIGKVEVTGSSGDDTIEGMMESVGFLSFRVLFRCMRGNRLISTGEVADFRRAVSLGRANKGLLVTTGNFTQEAHREASRGGAPEIDLMDGEKLIDKLKELSLGVKTEKVVVERVIIDRDWFQNIQL